MKRPFAVLQAKLGINLSYSLHAAPFILGTAIAGTIVRIGLSVLLARVLTRDGFGQYSYAMAVLGLVTLISLPGLDTAVLQAVARGYEGTYRICFRIRMRWAALGCAGLLAFAGWSAFAGENERAELLFVTSLFFVPFAAATTAAAFYRGRKDFRRASVVEIITLLAASVPAAGAAVLTRSPIWTLGTYLLAMAVANLAFTWQAINKVADQRVDSSARRFGRHLTLLALVPTLSVYLDRIVIEQVMSFEYVALYSIAVNLPDQARRLGNVVYGPAFPKAAALPRHIAYRKIIRLLPVLFLLFGGAAAIGALATPLAIGHLFPRYVEAIPYAQFSFVSFAVASVGAVFWDVLFPAHQDTRSILIINLVAGGAKILAVLVGVTCWGFWGLMASPLASMTAALLASLYLARTRYRPPDLKDQVEVEQHATYVN